MSVEEKVKRIVAEIFGVDEGELTRETRFVQDLHAKSVNIIEMLATMEEEFDLDIPIAQVRRNKTIGEAIDYLEKRLKEKQVSPRQA
jgi:acyl carrier protein